MMPTDSTHAVVRAAAFAVVRAAVTKAALLKGLAPIMGGGRGAVRTAVFSISRLGLLPMTKFFQTV